MKIHNVEEKGQQIKRKHSDSQVRHHTKKTIGAIVRCAFGWHKEATAAVNWNKNCPRIKAVFCSVAFYMYFNALLHFSSIQRIILFNSSSFSRCGINVVIVVVVIRLCCLFAPLQPSPPNQPHSAASLISFALNSHFHWNDTRTEHTSHVHLPSFERTHISIAKSRQMRMDGAQPQQYYIEENEMKAKPRNFIIACMNRRYKHPMHTTCNSFHNPQTNVGAKGHTNPWKWYERRNEQRSVVVVVVVQVVAKYATKHTFIRIQCFSRYKFHELWHKYCVCLSVCLRVCVCVRPNATKN